MTPPGQSKSIGVFAPYVWKGINCHLPVFRTYTSLEDNCDKSLLFLQDKIDFWDPYPLELSNDGILKFLE
ncbi:hypothetical protein B5K08_03045 [Rhizobium leguminosarum bv. trifolii]|uniref:Uncharacterized protein n=1 Tax=Rhizobium leguminosarum bv. trifolii TaxID=386 RepID=A0A3E1BWC6_RHILT|nr:hypothetical protein [Rhizobium leguminosarum]RFB98643.1 hypothetical protein B5K08_03045 [Rhizobium leguminosarum bv. trifolii]RFB99517.1 hypothetical protein B5K10_03040 [Rhizobium leguminosarum bv. trifolii]